jgi:diguanylate cyclase (GGDEF)-like protein/PAS domain S-box-containing protein
MGLIALLWLVGASALALLALISLRGHVRRKPALALLVLASALYALGYGLELAGDSLDWVLATYRIQYLAIAFAPTLLLWIAADLGELQRRWTRSLVVAGAAVSLATVAVVYTNAGHGLYHVAPRMDTSGPFALIDFAPGPWYWFFHAYVATALLAAYGLFLRAWLRAPVGSARRGQATAVALAALVPALGALVYSSRILPLRLDVSPIALAFSAFFIYRGITRHALADLTPIARDLVFERMSDPVLVLDLEGKVIDHNRAARDLAGGAAGVWLGRTPQEVLGRPLVPAVDERDATPVATIVERDPLEIGGQTFDLRIAHLKGRSGHALGRAVVLRDVTDHDRARRALARLATTDELTGIANRRHFLYLAERILERDHRAGAPTSVMLFDLDDFKHVNDSYGHQTGDELLRAIADTVTGSLRPGDLFGRHGGEEFAVCLPATGAADAGAAAERLRGAVAATVLTSAEALVAVTASVGVCTTSTSRRYGIEQLLACADAAQYAAKRGGGDLAVVEHLRECEGASEHQPL